MQFKEEISYKTHSIFFISSFLLLAGALFLKLGIQPLYLEEPRRALIALEMSLNKNLIVPTEFGEFYYNKPPLWNWVILLSYKIFNNYSEFAVRFFSVLSYILSGIIIFLAGRKYISPLFGMLSCMFFLIGIDTLFYFSQLGEIDIFYSLLIITSFIALFHFHTANKKFIAFFLFYFLIALATLTKGLPSIVFGGIGIIVLLAAKKRLKELFSFQHIAGASVFIIIIGAYLFLYSRYNDIKNLLQVLYSESAGRTVIKPDSGNFFTHVLLFPLDLLKNTLPASLFLLVVFEKKIIESIKKNAYLSFSVLILITNLLVYWLSPGSKQRYIYMLYPFFINIMVLGYLLSDKNTIRQKAINCLFIIVFVLSSLGLAIVPFFSDRINLNNLTTIALTASAFCILLLILYLKYPLYKIWFVILVFVVLRFVFDLTILPYRNQDSLALEMKDHGEKIASIAGNKNLYLYNGTLISRTAIFYIERSRMKVLGRDSVLLADQFYLTEQGQTIPVPHDTVYNLKYDREDFYLIHTK